MEAILLEVYTDVDGFEAAAEYRFDQPEIVIGRDPASTLFIDHKGVSRRHTRLFWDDAQVMVEDLDSSNGTYINQEHIDGPSVVISGDQISLGPAAVLIFNTASEFDKDAENAAASMELTMSLMGGDTVIEDDFESPPPDEIAAPLVPEQSTAIAPPEFYSNLFALARDWRVPAPTLDDLVQSPALFEPLDRYVGRGAPVEKAGVLKLLTHGRVYLQMEGLIFVPMSLGELSPPSAWAKSITFGLINSALGVGLGVLGLGGGGSRCDLGRNK